MTLAVAARTTHSFNLSVLSSLRPLAHQGWSRHVQNHRNRHPASPCLTTNSQANHNYNTSESTRHILITAIDFRVRHPVNTPFEPCQYWPWNLRSVRLPPSATSSKDSTLHKKCDGYYGKPEDTATIIIMHTPRSNHKQSGKAIGYHSDFPSLEDSKEIRIYASGICSEDSQMMILAAELQLHLSISICPVAPTNKPTPERL
ncbi:hypothetical protein B0H66DRAFT_536036 [Apodospora peruviana]|uniref:Uncharacterized protein n=1 Tax=Apodospora peruviana TaxID=516989 RepID=A0AAE0M0X8_9PEZI|nr:hypothetical protein B0H66DRAFT_536036 [Apodospora peruviana]